MSNRLPESLVSRFCVAVRDVLWFKKKVDRYLERAGVPLSILSSACKDPATTTIKKCQEVVDLLEQSGDRGQKILQNLIAQISEWEDFSHLKTADMIKTAKSSQAALKSEIRAYANRTKYLEEKERELFERRNANSKPAPLNHKKLQGFRDRFDVAYAMKDHQARGNALEALMNEIFDYYCPVSRGPFSRAGEQVDGHFQYDGHDYFCEIRWRAEQVNAAAISVLRDRAAAGFGGDIRALFISFDGFTQECLDSLAARAGQERVILMDGVDLRAVLNADIGFDELLKEKLAWAIRHQRAFVTAREIILGRIAPGATPKL